MTRSAVVASGETTPQHGSLEAPVRRFQVNEVALRRIDWRFLLPRPENGSFRHLVVRGGPAGIVECLQRSGIAERVSESVPAHSRVDALAVLDGARCSFKQAADALNPGGVLYYEVQRRLPRDILKTPARTRHTMQALGLVPSGSYLITPNVADARQYVPLDVSTALDWYVTSRLAPLSRMQFLVGNVLKWAMRLSRRNIARLAPCYALIASRPEIDDRTPSLLGDVPSGQLSVSDRLHPLLLTSGLDDGSRVVMLPFSEESPSPPFIVKIGRSPTVNDNVVREQHTLIELRSRLSSSLQSTIPQPLGTFTHRNLVAGVESFAPGKSLLVMSWQWQRPIEKKMDDLRRVAEWLAALQQQSSVDGATWTGNQLRRELSTLVARYAAAFGATPNEALLFARVCAYLDELGNVVVPLTLKHIDLVPANVFRDSETLTVIDWEDRGYARTLLGPALCDLLHFTAHWNVAVLGLHGHEDQYRSFERLFLDPDVDDGIARGARAVLVGHMSALHLDRQLLPVLLVYTTLEHALERLNRHNSYGGPPGAARSWNRYIAHLGLIAGRSDNLFRIETLNRHGDGHDGRR